MTLVKLFASALHWSFFMLSKKTAILVRKSLLMCSVLIVCMDMASAATCDLTQITGGQLPQQIFQAKRLTAQDTAQQLGREFTSWTTYDIPQGCSIIGNWSVKISTKSASEDFKDDETGPTYTFRLKCGPPDCREPNSPVGLLVKVKLTVVFADSSGITCGTTTKTISTTDITYTNASNCANKVTVMASSTLLQDNRLKAGNIVEYSIANLPSFEVVNSRISQDYTSTQYSSNAAIAIAPPSLCTFTTTTQNVDLKTFNITSVNKNDLTTPINPIQFQITFKDCNAQTMLLGSATLQWTFLSPGGDNLNKLKNSAVTNPAKGVDLQLKAATGQKKNQNCTDMTDLVIKSNESYFAICESSTGLNALDFTAYYLLNGENLQPGKFSSTATLMLDLN